MSGAVSQILAFERTLPCKNTGNYTDRKGFATAIGTSVAEIDLTALVKGTTNGAGGAWISFQARVSAIFIGENKAATGGNTLTNVDTTSTGLKLNPGDPPIDFWISGDLPFIEHIAVAASSSLLYWKSDRNFMKPTGN